MGLHEVSIKVLGVNELRQHRGFCQQSRLLSAGSPEWHETTRWLASYYRGVGYPTLAALKN